MLYTICWTYQPREMKLAEIVKSSLHERFYNGLNERLAEITPLRLEICLLCTCTLCCLDSLGTKPIHLLLYIISTRVIKYLFCWSSLIWLVRKRSHFLDTAGDGWPTGHSPFLALSSTLLSNSSLNNGHNIKQHSRKKLVHHVRATFM